MKHFLGLAVLLSLAFTVVADEPDTIVPLGKLDAFWRYSAALGPFHEGGQALDTVPDYMQKGHFAYRKRPYVKESLFADHLSMVRILGGFKDQKSLSDVRERDLAYRNRDGKIAYRMHLLQPRLQPYIENGYSTDLTIVLDNVPWCFPESPRAGSLGQSAPPQDPEEWYRFIQAVCEELVRILGRDQANQLRFRVGTENGGRQRFDGTHEEYVFHYQNTAAAVRSVLPGVDIGCYNISGVSVVGVRERHNVRAFELAEHCVNEQNVVDGQSSTPFDWVAYSRYFRPGDDPLAHAQICHAVWEVFEDIAPELEGVSREIHEFGIAPWGEVAKGVFSSAEPGALGAALTCQMMLRLREVGIQRLWHWGVLDRYRNQHNQLDYVPQGIAWLMSVLDAMRGGEAFLLEPSTISTVGTDQLALAVKLEDRVMILISSYNRDIANHSSEFVTFSLPHELGRLAGKPVNAVRLNRDSSIHDQIRRDLSAAGLLEEDFVSRPDRLGTVRQMGIGRLAEKMVGEAQSKYEQLWVDSLTYQPITHDSCVIESMGFETTVTVELGPPELLVLGIPNAK
ncbi:hypothetical protein QEH59_15430 [Coraliomargarita sp. SDUM461004]|uniref:Glycosyl hydrolases family 39 N-terminal catalytic domain-containing protein n=1 Tax=Thalassobacterium sedimentorum TaxID=3041258 RepID=A0ABU1AM52_9BACT|nr:hypothetical protein [Coraliomargarita sp. SDUM461004]MDQ8195824.1 hypothetical protein [Coraliomargarita sp. SDUM461004]